MKLRRAIWLLGLALSAPAWAAAPKPNVVLIVADDLGDGGVGCYGETEIPTPNIDALARGGVRLTNGYVSCPVCSPTRAGLMTGRYQQRFGHEFNPGGAEGAAQNFGLPLNQVTLAQRLKNAGYATGMVGKWHLGYRPEYVPTSRGFDEFFGFLGGAHPYLPNSRQGQHENIFRGTEPVIEKGELTEAFRREALAFLDRHKGEPFFLYLPFNAVHGPLQASDAYLQRFASIEDEKRRTHAAQLTALDDAIGAVIAKLRDLGVEDNTLILFHSDNGGPTRVNTSRNGPLRGFKGQVYEGGIRVPFIVRWKGHIPEGTTFDKPAIALDILPTVMNAVGAPISVDEALDGVDLMPYLSGQSDRPPHERLYWRFGDQSAVREGDWKLVKTAEGVELFNLASDIGESKDLSRDEPRVVQRLTDELAEWDDSLAEPLWRKGARANAKAKAARRAARAKAKSNGP